MECTTFSSSCKKHSTLTNYDGHGFFGNGCEEFAYWDLELARLDE